jgi:hypothetical protein
VGYDDAAFDTVITGDCEVCDEPGELCEDPYDQDVNNNTSLVYLCNGCYQDRVDEI